jgi:hypothetical protein
MQEAFRARIRPLRFGTTLIESGVYIYTRLFVHLPSTSFPDRVNNNNKPLIKLTVLFYRCKISTPNQKHWHYLPWKKEEERII